MLKPPALLRFLGASLFIAATVHAQEHKKSPTSKVFVAETKGDTQIDTGKEIDDLTKKSVYNAQGTVFETKANSTASVVLSNGTGIFFDVNTRVEIRGFEQEPFRPNRTDADDEPSISKTHLYIDYGVIGISTSKLAAGSTMTYEMPLATAYIRGRQAVIQVGDNFAEISLIQGDATVQAGPTAIPTLVKGGQQILIRPGKVGEANLIVIQDIPPGKHRGGRAVARIPRPDRGRRRPPPGLFRGPAPQGRRDHGVRRCGGPGRGGQQRDRCRADRANHPSDTAADKRCEPNPPVTGRPTLYGIHEIPALRLLTAAAVAAIVVSGYGSRAGGIFVSLEDGKDHLFVDATIETSYDSNVFTNTDDHGSLVYQGSLGTEFTRRAGWIGVNATASLTWARYANFRSQDYVDPKVSAELTKQSGRTTGSLTFSAQRENRADVDVNTRDIFWNYDAGLNFQYPVIERYSISGSFDYARTDYQDQALFINQTTYTGNLYLYYILNEQRDLFIDYRERYTAEDRGVSDLDDSLSGGVSGKVYGPFNGSLQAGYQKRTPVRGPADERVTSNDITVSGTLTWNINRRMNLTTDLSRDFSTTAEAQSIESSRLGLTFQDSFTAKAKRDARCRGRREPVSRHRADDAARGPEAG